VLGVSRLYDERELRLSYVAWQEEAAPYLIVELLSPGTEKEDLGATARNAQQPPSKWIAYERILRIPYYILFSRYTDGLRCFELNGDGYQETTPADRRLWLPKAGLGLGMWYGEYQGIQRNWLRFYDAVGEWILTPAELEQQRADRLAAQLKALGIEPEE